MAEMQKKPRTRDAEEILDRLAGGDPTIREHVEAHKLNMRVAEMVFEAREAAGLTQAQLAEMVGTSQSAISRLEDADYEEGHSLSILKRIGDALHQRLELRFVPEPTP